MKTWSFSLILFCFIGFSPRSIAHKKVQVKNPCIHNLLVALDDEFSRPPEDSNDGRITDRIFMSTTSLVEAYRRGIFPWEINDDGAAVWFSPPQRGILDFTKMKIPRKDAQFIRRALESGQYLVTDDQAFSQVMAECAKARRYYVDSTTGKKVPTRTWIKPTFLEEYPKLAQMGLAHSTEVWREGRLVGGFYGVFIDGHFTGESMFHHESDVIKLALDHVIKRLKSNGHTWMDTQQLNGVIRQWGGEEIPRAEFLEKLDRAHQASLPF